jgi:hypothetical protein
VSIPDCKDCGQRGLCCDYCHATRDDVSARVAGLTAAAEGARVAVAQAQAQVRAVHDGYARLVAAATALVPALSISEGSREPLTMRGVWFRAGFDTAALCQTLISALAALDRSPWVVATDPSAVTSAESALGAESPRPDAVVAPEQGVYRRNHETPRPDALAEVPVAVEATETPEAPEARLVLEGLADWLDRYRACAPRLAAEVPGGARVEWLLPGVVFDVLLAAVKRARGGA